jgi:hypothetical protein
MKQITLDEVLSQLMLHKGKNSGIHVRDLVMRLTGQVENAEYQERSVRGLVKRLRLAGHPICGHPSTGYFMAVTTDELEETCRFLRSRAMSSIQAESRLRQITVAELLGSIQSAAQAGTT